jgi:hypothetical protein
MINVVFSPQCREVMRLLEVDPNDVWTTINDRHRGLVSEGLTRIVAMHWFSDDSFLLVDSVVTKRKVIKDQNQVQFKQVTAQLAIKLPPDLPAGTVSRDMSMADVLIMVAESFGHPVTCHPNSPPSTLYTGQWDGKNIDMKLRKAGSMIFATGTFFPEKSTCELVWALDIDRYRRWLTLN